MKEKLLQGLNDLLDIDHDLVRDAFTQEIDLHRDSMLYDNRHAYEKGGIQVMTALSLLGVIVDGEPIKPVFEDGIIQRFE